MKQIVSAKRTKEGTFIVEVKPLRKPRVSETGETTQVAGTDGWAETLPGVTYEDEEGIHPLTACVQIRKKNKKGK